MFNLEKSVGEWRQQMLDGGVKSPAPLEELEAHMREEIELQIKAGRGEAEAFESAVEKIGLAQVVRGEFWKIDNRSDEIEWKIMESVFGIVGSAFPLWVCGVLPFFPKAGVFAEPTAGQRVSCVVAMVVFAVLIWSGRLGYKVFPVIPSRRSRGIIASCCVAPVIVWWIIFMDFIVPHHDFDMGQFVVAFLWGFLAPGGAAMGLSWGFETAARKKTVKLHV